MLPPARPAGPAAGRRPPVAAMTWLYQGRIIDLVEPARWYSIHRAPDGTYSTYYHGETARPRACAPYPTLAACRAAHATFRWVPACSRRRA